MEKEEGCVRWNGWMRSNGIGEMVARHGVGEMEWRRLERKDGCVRLNGTGKVAWMRL